MNLISEYESMARKAARDSINREIESISAGNRLVIHKKKLSEDEWL